MFVNILSDFWIKRRIRAKKHVLRAFSNWLRFINNWPQNASRVSKCIKTSILGFWDIKINKWWSHTQFCWDLKTIFNRKILGEICLYSLLWICNFMYMVIICWNICINIICCHNLFQKSLDVLKKQNTDQFLHYDHSLYFFRRNFSFSRRYVSI